VSWGQTEDVPFPVTGSRLAGFRDAMEQTGQSWETVPVVVATRNSRDEGRRAVSGALDQYQPDVVIAMSDQLAAGAHDALRGTARVSGWDDSDLASELGFCSIRQSLYDQGVTCARIAAGLTLDVPSPTWTLTRR